MAVAVIMSFLAALALTYAADPEVVSDFKGNSTKVDASFFTFTQFRGDVTAAANDFVVKKASVVEFPALDGLGVSMAKLSFQPTAMNVPHIHPRGTELLFVQQGCLTVGLIDSSNKLFVQKLEQGDVFVFPRGLVHFQINEGQTEVKAISSFSSSNAGTVSLPVNLFGSNIDTAVLAKAFKVSADVINTLKSSLTPK